MEWSSFYCFSRWIFLINNLDLFVVNSNTSQVYYGNQPLYPSWDNLNNNEQVTLRVSDITSTLGTIFSLHIRGANVPQGPTNFSLVITGTFQILPTSRCSSSGPICPNSCSNQGTCDTQTGLCTCQSGYGGSDCSIGSYPLLKSITHQYESLDQNWLPFEWKYYYFDLFTNMSLIDGFRILVNRTGAVITDPVIYVGFTYLPTPAKFDYVAFPTPALIASNITIGSPQAGRYYFGFYSLFNSTANIFLDSVPGVSSPASSSGGFSKCAIVFLIISALVANFA